MSEQTLWDPFAVLPAARRWLWIAAAAWVTLFQGPSFVQMLRPPENLGVDFFQDWASARNSLTGRPIYAPHEETAELYLGYKIDTNVRFYVGVNAHPPTSVLLMVPLAWLPYPDAFLVWDLVSLTVFLASLWLVGRQLDIRSSLWSLCPLVTLLLLCFPFRQNLQLGQLGLVLAGLLVGTWVADRAGWPALAGTLLAVATAIKLFPGFLFLYFALRRDWRALAAGAAVLALLTGLTAAILGPDVYSIYVQQILPQGRVYWSGWSNASLVSFWYKLFDPATDRMFVEPLWRSPFLARAGAGLSVLVLLALLTPAVWRARSRAECDRAFGLGVLTMLLVSPITWEHYLPLLVLPLALTWARLPRSVPARYLFVLILLAFWIQPEPVYELFLPGGSEKNVAMGLHTLTCLSFQCYALLALYGLVFLAPAEPHELRYGISLN